MGFTGSERIEHIALDDANNDGPESFRLKLKWQNFFFAWKFREIGIFFVAKN